jgi:hypothetical protein
MTTLITFLCIQLLSIFNSQPLKNLDSNTKHAFHICKTDMVYKPAEKSLQITMHIFIDDLELALEKQGQSKLFIGTEKEKSGANDLIINYLQKNLNLQINGKKTAYAWIGKEPTADRQALWVYLEVKDVKSIKDVQVENKMLTEVYEDQKNIVQINVPNKKQGYFLLERSKTSDKAVF